MLVNDIEIPTKQKEFVNLNIIEVTCGTTGRKGGDWGHGSRLMVNITDLSSTGWEVYVDQEKFDTPRSVEIIVGGDAELETFADAFEWIAKELRAGVGKSLELSWWEKLKFKTWDRLVMEYHLFRIRHKRV